MDKRNIIVLPRTWGAEFPVFSYRGVTVNLYAQKDEMINVTEQYNMRVLLKEDQTMENAKWEMINALNLQHLTAFDLSRSTLFMAGFTQHVSETGRELTLTSTVPTETVAYACRKDIGDAHMVIVPDDLLATLRPVAKESIFSGWFGGATRTHKKNPTRATKSKRAKARSKKSRRGASSKKKRATSKRRR